MTVGQLLTGSREVSSSNFLPPPIHILSHKGLFQCLKYANLVKSFHIPSTVKVGTVWRVFAAGRGIQL